ncbi:MAG TPA: NUDIX hydrolase [Candidatus Saccharimonadales bacterium]|nr:NUDIX hydrolase [Candidatus Saccharimonadales bacterium]
MKNEEHPLTQEEFDLIYSKVPRLGVEIIVKNKSGGVYLTKRASGPCKGLWHIPGGTVRFGEQLVDAVRRVAGRELRIDVKGARNCGYFEVKSHLEDSTDYPVGIVFEVTDYAGTPKPNNEASDAGWFTTAPRGMHADHDTFLFENGYLLRP